jgi:ATP-binding cassette subfamily B (MDR/TAP) protein 1
MSKSEPICSPFTRHLKLSFKQCPLCDEEKKKMKVTYASTVGSLIYAIVCRRLDIAHIIGVVSLLLFNPGKEH